MISMSISEVVLFVSSASKPSMNTLGFAQRSGLPIDVVRLDSAKSRQIAATGKYFQIRSVPTLVVGYSDGNLQLFVGAPKITQWLSMITAGPPNQSEPSNFEEPPPNRESRSRREPAENEVYKESKRTPVIEPVEEDITEEKPVEEEGTKKRRVKPKKKAPPVNFEEEEPQEMLVDEPRSEVSNGSRSKMSDIVNMARQLEKEREASLGYDESKLPKF